MKKAKAVLFDFDGVLAKTMEDNFNAWRAALAEYGILIKPDDYYPLEGLKVLEVSAKLFSRYGREVVNAAEVVQKKEAYYLKNNRFELYPGVLQLLDELRSKRIPIAVVTAALVSRLGRSCPPGFLERFNAVVTGDDAGEGKPSPAPYLHAAAKLSMKPEDCIVVENAPLGVESAKRAGCYCIALCTTMGGSFLKRADERYDSFIDLRNSKSIQALLD